MTLTVLHVSSHLPCEKPGCTVIGDLWDLFWIKVLCLNAGLNAYYESRYVTTKTRMEIFCNSALDIFYWLLRSVFPTSTRARLTAFKPKILQKSDCSFKLRGFWHKHLDISIFFCNRVFCSKLKSACHLIFMYNILFSFCVRVKPGSCQIMQTFEPMLNKMFLANLEGLVKLVELSRVRRFITIPFNLLWSSLALISMTVLYKMF